MEKVEVWKTSRGTYEQDFKRATAWEIEALIEKKNFSRAAPKTSTSFNFSAGLELLENIEEIIPLLNNYRIYVANQKLEEINKPPRDGDILYVD